MENKKQEQYPDCFLSIMNRLLISGDADVISLNMF